MDLQLLENDFLIARQRPEKSLSCFGNVHMV